MGFQMGRPSALYDAIVSRISVGQDFPLEGTYEAVVAVRVCSHMASLSIKIQDSQKFGELLFSSYGFIVTGRSENAFLYLSYIAFF